MQEYRVLGDAYFLNSDIWRLEEGVSIYNRLYNTGLTAKSDFEEYAVTLI